ncbi:MAG: HlyD family efflux transporter periplasmic adaptor subunit [Deltaproteobacteria bacterium]|nr:HlyD family efflux transporter periplasmic adaptor subunit [Deltaproteobacteria bacterium]
MKTTRKTMIPFAILGVIILFGIIFYFSRNEKREIIYQEVSVTKGPIKNTILSSGVVQPENRLEVKAPIAGRIEKILVDEGQLVKKGQVLAWMSSSERAALLDTAKTKGKEEWAYWEEAYKATPLMAPISGQIILRSVEPGQTITIQDALIVMSDRLCVKAQVDETDIAQVKLNQKVEVTLDAYAEHPMEGTVVHIAYESKTVNNVTTYLVDIIPSSIPDFMKSGMTANVVFTTGEKEETLLVPSTALQKENGKFKVLLANAGDTKSPTQLSVEVGVNDGKQAEIVSGLKEGDKVLIPKLSPSARKKDSETKSPLSPFGNRGKRSH